VVRVPLQGHGRSTPVCPSEPRVGRPHNSRCYEDWTTFEQPYQSRLLSERPVPASKRSTRSPLLFGGILPHLGATTLHRQGPLDCSCSLDPAKKTPGAQTKESTILSEACPGRSSNNILRVRPLWIGVGTPRTRRSCTGMLCGPWAYSATRQ